MQKLYIDNEGGIAIAAALRAPGRPRPSRTTPERAVHRITGHFERPNLFIRTGRNLIAIRAASR